jgi:cell division protein FtsI (penicillin-binding protein 3)
VQPAARRVRGDRDTGTAAHADRRPTGRRDDARRPAERRSPGRTNTSTTGRTDGRAGSRTDGRSTRDPRDDRTQQGRPSSSRSSSSRSSTSGPSARSRSRAPQPPSPRRRRELTFNEPVSAPDRSHRVRKPQPAKKRRVRAERPAPRARVDRFGLGNSALRLRMVLIVIVLVLGYVLFRVGRIQSSDGESYREAAADLWQRSRELPADRGTIFDRDGEELALSIPGYSVSVNPKLVTNPEATARMLQTTLGLDEAATRDLFDDLTARDKGFVYVQRQVDQATGEAIAELGVNGINVDPEPIRVLPGGATGWSVIGRTNIDGEGIAGLEAQYDDLLTGQPGELRKEVAPGGRSVAGSEEITAAPVAGNDLVLTLDRSIQFQAEKVLVERVSEVNAKAGTIVIMDTDTGDILSMASVDRNDDGVVEVTSGNYTAVNAYEPGSVAKVITVAAGLNEGSVAPNSYFVVPWRKQYADDLLADSHQHPDESMSVEQILVESSNIGTIMVQQSLGGGDWDTARQTHWNYMRSFGLGEKTALDFPGESPGILKDWTDLWGSERVTVAYGQGLASTSIQLATAVNVIANDGTYVAPRLVDGVVGPDGTVTEADPAVTHEVLSTETAEEMQRMMRQVVCRGTGTRAQLGFESMSVAGKTGTGLKAQPNGTYLNAAGEQVYYASFVGFFPAEDPQITILVSIDEPPAGDINRFGGTAAAPVFAKLAPTIVHEQGLLPPEPDPTMACP